MAFVSSDPLRFWCTVLALGEGEIGIPFEVADDIFLDNIAKETVRDAVDTWNDIVVVDHDIPELRLFARHPPEETQPDYLVFTKHPERCSSQIGRQGGPQLVGCPIGGAGTFTPGNIMHEVMHAVGFQHEQCRPDRKDFIDIIWDNIEQENEDEFCKVIPDGQVIGEYDYGSIMHYGRTAFSANGLDTIVPTDPSAVIGQRDAPSPGDILAMDALCVKVPAVQEHLTPATAAQRVRNVGLVPVFWGDPNGTFIQQQSPFGGKMVGRGTIVSLKLSAGQHRLLPPGFNILNARSN
jgi:hypothetical protein